jgi:hypothetical protein
MDLKTRYETAPETTYAGRVRTGQAADVGVGAGVNFMDAGYASPGGATADTMQSNFQRRASEDKIFTRGTETTIAAGDLKGATRWYGRALNFAFTNPSSTSTGLTNSQYTSFKGIRPGTKDVWADNPSFFHRWKPSAEFRSSLTGLTQTRATGRKPTRASTPAST